MASQSGKRPLPSQQPATTIPDDLALEILVLLPGKDIARCKCVCTSWRSIITSPLFREIHRNHHGGLMLYALHGGGVPCDDDKDRIHLFRFYNSPPRRAPVDSAAAEESISPMTELSIRMGFFFQHGIRIVNGLVCVVTGMGSDIQLQVTIYNVCTGEKMPIPEHVPYSTRSSTFHLGYDPASRTYKLLRMIFPTTKNGFHIMNRGKRKVRAHILTLRPSGSLSRWRKLNYEAAGLADVYASMRSVYEFSSAIDPENSSGGYAIGKRTFSGDDGVFCWFHRRFITIFDLNREKFRRFKLPAELTTGVKNVVGSRTEFKECGRLAITLWAEEHPTFPASDQRLECFVSEEDESERWSKRYCTKPAFLFNFVAGRSVSPEKIQLMIPFFLPRGDCCYSCQVNKTGEFWVGNFGVDTCTPSYFRRVWNDGALSYLGDSNRLYLSLDDVLRGVF